MSATLPLDKPALRKLLRMVRADVTNRSPIRVDPAFLARLSHGVTVASYVPMSSEADPSPLARAAADAGCVMALPHIVDRTSEMRFLAWDSEAAMTAGPMGLHQPPHDATEHVPDIILTPLVGFDRRGNRLGQGGGHYDRAFARFPDAWRIGIALSVQQTDRLVPDPWDIPLHAIATDREWIVP